MRMREYLLACAFGTWRGKVSFRMISRGEWESRFGDGQLFDMSDLTSRADVIFQAKGHVKLYDMYAAEWDGSRSAEDWLKGQTAAANSQWMQNAIAERNQRNLTWQQRNMGTKNVAYQMHDDRVQVQVNGDDDICTSGGIDIDDYEPTGQFDDGDADFINCGIPHGKGARQPNSSCIRACW